VKKIIRERREYPRYDTEVKIYFHIQYDIETKVKFKILSSVMKSVKEHKYSGLSLNASAAGLCFVSKKKLKKGDILFIEVFEPKIRRPVKMEGEVRWSHKIAGRPGDAKKYDTGVRLILVNGKSVADSVYFDKKYKIMWSIVLESLFGSFAAAIKKAG
jgi:hypothetical protein